MMSSGEISCIRTSISLLLCGGHAYKQQLIFGIRDVAEFVIHFNSVIHKC